jgi:hypothetical protein
MKPIYVTEPGGSGGIGAMGMRILVASLRRRGFPVVRVAFDKSANGGQVPMMGV